jgi:hypothetical protein
MKIDSSKADVIPPRLAVAMMLFSASEAAHESKPWDWRNDPHLSLGSASPGTCEHLAEVMIKHGIDPDADKYSRAEKMSVFVLACGEHLIMGPTEPGAVTLHVEPGPAQSFEQMGHAAAWVEPTGTGALVLSLSAEAVQVASPTALPHQDRPPAS